MRSYEFNSLVSKLSDLRSSPPSPHHPHRPITPPPHHPITPVLPQYHPNITPSRRRAIPPSPYHPAFPAESRSQRLSQESFPLPPTHFFILGSLGALVALSYVLLAPPTMPFGNTPLWAAKRGGDFFFLKHPAMFVLYLLGGISSSRGIFALLVACLTLINDFSRDLNSPFGGIYQVTEGILT